MENSIKKWRAIGNGIKIEFEIFDVDFYSRKIRFVRRLRRFDTFNGLKNLKRKNGRKANVI